MYKSLDKLKYIKYHGYTTVQPVMLFTIALFGLTGAVNPDSVKIKKKSSKIKARSVFAN